ncbi:MAG TPA: arabinose transporter [Xanthomonadaceae bacterium]|nr:arabinose transporter [Xanthomonadaceae bacterium]
MSFASLRDPAQKRLLLLTVILFGSYLCVAIPLPVLPLQVTQVLGLGNGWAGLAVGIAFLATVVTRGYAGNLSDHRGAKPAVVRGLALYVAGGLLASVSGLPALAPATAFPVLLAGRLLLGLGESLVGVGVIAWGVGIVGPAHSGKVLALIGTAIYAALAVGGPMGLALLERLGFAGTMAVSALLPCLGLLAIARVEGIAPHPRPAVRPSLWSVAGKVWPYGTVVCLQGIGFAAIGAFFVLHFLQRGWDHAGLGLTAFGSGFVLVRLCLGHLPDRLGGLPVAIGSLLVEAIGQALIWTAPTPALAFVGAFMTGLGCSLVFPAMGREVVQRVEPPLRGAALGGYAAFQDLAYGLTGPLAGLLADRAGYDSVFLIGCVSAAVGAAISIRLRGGNAGSPRG